MPATSFVTAGTTCMYRADREAAGTARLANIPQVEERISGADSRVPL